MTTPPFGRADAGATGGMAARPRRLKPKPTIRTNGSRDTPYDTAARPRVDEPLSFRRSEPIVPIPCSRLQQHTSLSAKEAFDAARRPWSPAYARARAHLHARCRSGRHPLFRRAPNGTIAG